MPTLLDVLELVREARDFIESGRVNDAAAYLEMIEDDLAWVIGTRDPQSCQRWQYRDSHVDACNWGVSEA